MGSGTFSAVRLALIAALSLFLCLPLGAHAAEPPPLLWQAPSSGVGGAGPNQIANPRGIAADPQTGHVYIADAVNHRINEFDAWGVFVKAWGWGVRNGASELQVCTAATGCQQGTAGSGPGQLNLPLGIAVDIAGDVYVHELENFRVSKFSSDGDFLLTIGGEVNKTTSGNVCVAGSGDVCGVGVSGTDPGEFSNGAVGTYLTASPDGTIWVGDVNRLQQFEPTGAFKSQIPTPQPGATGSLAADPSSGDLYFDFAQGINPPARPNVYRLKPSNGEVLDELPVPVPKALAVDANGSVYVVDDPFGFGPVDTEPFIRIFDATGQEVLGEDTAFERPTDGTTLTALGTSSACGVPEPVLYVAHLGGIKTYIRAFGPHPRDPNCLPPQVAPTIDNQYVISASSTTALLRAEINPHFWADTTYYVEYGLAPCASGGCDQKQPVPPALLTAEVVDDSINTAGVALSDLAPNSKYHFRFVAESTGGGPVYGLDPDGAGPGQATFELGLEGTFSTFPKGKVPGADSCPNAAYRIGLGAHLPNCRAYELVSPVDKKGSDISVLFNARNKPAELNQGSVDGNRLSFSAQTSFGDALSAPYTSQYLATRQEGVAWSTHGISPPRETESVAFFQPPRLDVQFKAFSADLCSGWLLQDTDPPLAPGGVTGYLNLYRRQNCGAESYEAVTSSEPDATSAEIYWPELQGTSADGSHAVFRANAKLTDDASDAKDGEAPIYQIYEHFEGGLRLVSVLPGSAGPSNVSSSVGTGSIQLPENRSNSVWHAVSADGSKIFWTASKSGPGPLYVRIDGLSTVTVSATSARFLGAAADGSRAVFLREGGLYEFNTASLQTTLIAEDAKGVMGMSDDASRIYLVSTGEIEDEGVAGEPNLYLYERGVGTTYITTISEADASTVAGAFSSPINPEPVKHTARVTPDGAAVVFVSDASLTGYDNRDAESGEPDSEVFLYDAEADELVCVSCNPTGARPSGRDVFPSTALKFWTAARIVPWASQHYAPRALSEDGSRVFFESFEGLVARDANGRQDVYQWERAGSDAECEQTGGELFVEEAAGCLSLISSGTSSIDTQFVDASADGRDVFFKTSESLLPQDPGLVDIYDAREGGGLPVPPAPRPDCQPATNCQSPQSPPVAVAPRSAVFVGPGNSKVKPCPKGKRRVVRKGKSKCVPRKHKRARHKGQAQGTGRSGR